MAGLRERSSPPKLHRSSPVQSFSPGMAGTPRLARVYAGANFCLRKRYLVNATLPRAMADAAAPATPSTIPPQLIVGLGNPGAKYASTRHNVGFDAIDALAKRWMIDLAEQKKFKGDFGEGILPRLCPPPGKLRLLKPHTYMNLSGQSIRAVVDWYKLPPESVLLIYDDMDLPIGRLRLRLSGSAGGHNGVKSAIAHLGTQDFPRLRIGIGAPRQPDGERETTVSHVLGKFSPKEQKIIDETLQVTLEAIELGLRQGLAKAMSLYNNREAVQG